MTAPLHEQIRNLRLALQLDQIEFGQRLGLGKKSKGRVSLIERGLAPVSQSVAIAIESLSGGRIDAALLNAEIAAARAGFQRVPVAANQNGGDDEFPADAEGSDVNDGLDFVRLCILCERRMDRPGVHDCTATDCPHAAREAA